MHKDTYERRRKQDLCPLCGGKPEAGFTRCAHCRIREASKIRHNRTTRRDKGECAACGSNDLQNKWQCKECYEKERKRVFEQERVWRQAGVCTKCGKVRVLGSFHCAHHVNVRKRKSDRQRLERIKNGQCVQCAFTLPDGWNLRHCEKCVARGRRKTENMRREVFSWYGSKCECCGESSYYFLTLDHIYNDGGEERKRNGGQNKVLWQMYNERKPSDRYRVLCYNCNCAREFHGTCPHTWPNVNEKPEGTLRRRGKMFRLVA